MTNQSNSYIEQIFFHYILNNQIYLNTTKSEFFSNQGLRDLFDIAKEHSLKYKEAPGKDQLFEILKIKGLSEKYNDDILSALYNTKSLLTQYDEKWLTDNVSAWIQLRNLDSVMRKSIAYMKTTNVNPENASAVVEKVRSMLTSETAIDFSFNIGSDFFDAASHLQTRLARKSSGYDYIDLCLGGGYASGSLVAFLGGPKSGKSYVLCNLAAQSIKQGNNTAYITLELQEELVNKRIGSNLLNVPVDEYDELTKNQPLLKEKLNKLKQSSLIPLGNLHIKEFSASTASSNDICNYLKKTEEILGIKFKNVFIDYLNIMKNWRNPNTENTYMKIKQISEDVRAMGQDNGWTCISVTQTNRAGLDNTDLTLGNTSESIGLIQTVDALFAIITDPIMKSRGEYYFKCLANRNAGFENTKKRYTMDWKYGRIEEDKDSPIQDLDFQINSIMANQTVPRGQYQKPSHSIIDAAINAKINNDIIVTTPNITGSELF
jgi:replicative DNA helicase